MTQRSRLMLSFVLATVAAFSSITRAAAAGAAAPSTSVHWNCSTALLPDFKPQGAANPNVGEGVAYLYAGHRDLHTNYGAAATFVAPIEARHGWYDTGIRLGPLNENNGFVQVEISHWARFDYRGHVAIVWALPHTTTVQYRDTGLFVSDKSSSLLSIMVRDQIVHLAVNGRDVCSTAATPFVSSSEQKYFQIRTETGLEGDNTGARVSNLRLKRDGDTALKPFASHCLFHGWGVSWKPTATNTFKAVGAFYPGEARFFTGLMPDTACKIR